MTKLNLSDPLYSPKSPQYHTHLSNEIGQLEDKIDRLHLLSLEISAKICQLLQQHIRLEESDDVGDILADCLDDILYPYIQELETELQALLYSDNDLLEGN